MPSKWGFGNDDKKFQMAPRGCLCFKKVLRREFYFKVNALYQLRREDLCCSRFVQESCNGLLSPTGSEIGVRARLLFELLFLINRSSSFRICSFFIKKPIVLVWITTSWSLNCRGSFCRNYLVRDEIFPLRWWKAMPDNAFGHVMQIVPFRSENLSWSRVIVHLDQSANVCLLLHIAPEQLERPCLSGENLTYLSLR